MKKTIKNAVFCMLSTALIASCSKPPLYEEENVISSNGKDSASTSAATIYTYKTIGDDNSTHRLTQQDNIVYNSGASSTTVIDVKPANLKQSILGMGAALTGSAATNILRLSSTDRQKLYAEVFTKNLDSDNKKQGLDLNILRISIGASDYSIPYNNSDTQGYYTYHDGSAFDTNIATRTDTKNVIDVINEIEDYLGSSKNLYIIASAWSAPAWMKQNNSLIDVNEDASGTTTNQLKSDKYDDYALYLARYVKAMEGKGVWIDALTPGNEPRNSEKYPSMIMFSGDQGSFIPTLTTALNNIGLSSGHKVGILGGDNNFSGSFFQDRILDDNDIVASTSNGLRGVAFHAYNGAASDMGTVASEHSSAEVHMTEWCGNKEQKFESLSSQMKDKVLDCFSNQAKSVTFWNLALDNNSSPGPNIRPGDNSSRAFFTIPASGPTYNGVTRNLDYYLFGHVSRFIKSSAKRIESNMTSTSSIEGLVQVAFKDSDDWTTLVVTNTGSSSKSFVVKVNGSSTKKFFYTLNANSIVTFNWDSSI